MLVPKAREAGQDVLGDPVGEVPLLRVAAHIGEGQDDDGGLVGQGQRRLCLSNEC